jgi:hypothetical protein
MCNSRGHQQRTLLIAPKLFFSGIQQQLSNVYRDTQAQGVVREISVRTQDSIYSRRPPAQTNWLRVVLFKMGRRNFKQTFSFFNSQVQRDIRVAGAHSTCCWTVGKATAADRCQPWKDWNPPGLWVAAAILSLLCLNIVWTLLFKGGDNICHSKKNGNRSTKKSSCV